MKVTVPVGDVPPEIVAVQVPGKPLGCAVGQLSPVLVTRLVTRVIVAETVTGLFGIVKVHGLLVKPPAHETPRVVHLENCQVTEGVAVTVIRDPTVFEHPLGQLGVTDPSPEATFVVKM